MPPPPIVHPNTSPSMGPRPDPNPDLPTTGDLDRLELRLDAVDQTLADLDHAEVSRAGG